MQQIMVNKDRCKGCELCVNNCPQQILGMSKELNVKGYFYAKMIDPPRCIGCCMCAIMCPDVAIEVGANGTQYKHFAY